MDPVQMHRQMMPKPEDFLEVVPQSLHQPGLHLDAPQFEPVGIDPIQFDYSSQLVPSMDSPNFNIDYNQQQVPPPHKIHQIYTQRHTMQHSQSWSIWDV